MREGEVGKSLWGSGGVCRKDVDDDLACWTGIADMHSLHRTKPLVTRLSKILILSSNALPRPSAWDLLGFECQDP